MKIKLTSVFIDDQNKALEFYTKILGFVKKADFTAGKFRWLTVVSPEDSNGPQLVLEPNDNPAAKSYQESILKDQLGRSEEHTSELQSPCNLVCRLLLE